MPVCLVAHSAIIFTKFDPLRDRELTAGGVLSLVKPNHMTSFPIHQISLPAVGTQCTGQEKVVR
jgi:hypothetical protein